MEDPSTWRLKTAGGIKYKLKNGYPRGSDDLEGNNSTAEEVVIIRASDLAAFRSEIHSFPSITYTGNTFRIRRPRKMPGTYVLSAKSLTWKPFIESLPVDPYSSDPTADADTYGDYIEVTIQYQNTKPGQMEEPEDPNDPFSFLEVSEDSSQELLMLPGKGWWESDNEPCKDINIPVARLLTERQWNVRWPLVDSNFLAALLDRSDKLSNKINSAVMPLLYKAPVETVMYLGMSHQEEYQRVDNQTIKPAAQVTMHFLQKIGSEGGVTIGHNHFYREETGKWDILLNKGGNKMYEQADLNTLWQWI